MTLTPSNFRNANVPYVNASNVLQKSPVYFVVFGLVTGPLGTNSQVLPDAYSTGPIGNPTRTYKRFMTNPTSFQNQINVITSETTISSITFNLFNIGGDITRIATNYIMKNRLVTIYGGYEGFNESDFIPLYTGQINNWVRSQDATFYSFTVTDALKQLKGSILGGHTQLTQNYTPGQNTVFVTSTSGFASATDLYDGQGARSYIRIKDTLYSYTSITAVSFVGLTPVILNSNGAPDEVHQAGENVDNYVLFEANPVTMILQIAMSTGNGTNYSGTGTNYDVLPADQGIGIPYNQINITNFENQRGLYVSGMTFSNYFSEQVEALKFFQYHILRQANCYLFINRSGQLDIKMYYVAQGTLDAITLDDSNIIGVPQFDANLQTGNDFFNDIDIKYDYQPVQDFFVNEVITEDLASQQTFEEDATLSIEAKMVKSSLDGLNIVNRMTYIYLSRFSSPPPIITLNTFYQNHLLNPGDTVYLDSTVIPNYKTGIDGGLPILCECISVGTDFSTGRVNVTLLGIGFSSTGRYAGIASDSTPVFTSATDQDKLANIFVSSDAGVMNDNSPAYLITP